MVEGSSLARRLGDRNLIRYYASLPQHFCARQAGDDFLQRHSAVRVCGWNLDTRDQGQAAALRLTGRVVGAVEEMLLDLLVNHRECSVEIELRVDAAPERDADHVSSIVY